MALGRDFGWLWSAYAVSAFGTRLAFDAFALIAVLVLHAGTAEVSALAAVGLAVGAVVAAPLGPWVESRRKRSVMIGADLLRCAAMASVPVAFALDRLGFPHLLAVSVVVAAADTTFQAAAGACLKALVRPADLLAATSRFESTGWTTTALGPPLGGVVVGLFGPVVTVAVDAVSYLLSALGVRAIRAPEPRPARVGAPGTVPTGGPRTGATRSRDLTAGWRHVLADPVLRPLFANTVLVNALIMTTSPLLAVLLLGDLGFAPWQYGLAFALPCTGGLLGARLAGPLVARFGRRRVLVVAGTLRACWVPGLVFVRPGATGLLLVIAVEFALITCMGVFNPVFAALRLERVPADRVARVLSAWSVSAKAVTAALIALWGVLAVATGPRAAIGVAGALLLATPVLLLRTGPRRRHVPVPGTGPTTATDDGTRDP
ncbi:MFS transporter [Saccharothrix longispora]|uniref:MFS family permease n=1 Tax=Saccharothrix longispora TaxID=33920 RepID=A0ABU1Q6E6_9PSEU|nr:MFS transporter [Saccharothrix longispora]MDR6598467.1 MFS family permease [Saccharothrix longispora]